MSKPTIASLQAEIERLNERLIQADAINAAQAARIEKALAMYREDQKTIADLQEQLAAKPQAPAAKPAHDNQAVLAAMQAAKAEAMRTKKSVVC